MSVFGRHGQGTEGGKGREKPGKGYLDQNKWLDERSDCLNWGFGRCLVFGSTEQVMRVTGAHAPLAHYLQRLGAAPGAGAVMDCHAEQRD